MRHIPLESHPLRQLCESWNAKFNARHLSKYTAGEPCNSMGVQCVYRDCWYSSPIQAKHPLPMQPGLRAHPSRQYQHAENPSLWKTKIQPYIYFW